MDIVQQWRDINLVMSCRNCNDTCRRSLSKLANRVEDIDRRLMSCEGGIDRNTEEIKTVASAQREQELRIKQLEESEQVRTSNSAVEDILKEMQEREAKSLNIRITFLPESEAKEPLARKRDDMEGVIRVAKLTGVAISTNDIKRCIRIGYKEQNRRPRPLIVSLSDEDKRNSILDGSKKLKTSDELKGVKIFKDLTKRQQKCLAECYEDAASKNYKGRESGVKWIVNQTSDPPKVKKIVIKEH